jgi:hypothetical protein
MYEMHSALFLKTGCYTRALTHFSRARGTPGTDTGALDRTNSAGHRVGAADHHDRTPAKPKLVDDKA